MCTWKNQLQASLLQQCLRWESKNTFLATALVILLTWACHLSWSSRITPRWQCSETCSITCEINMRRRGGRPRWCVLVNVFARDKRWSSNISAVKVLGIFCLLEVNVFLVRAFRAFQNKQVLSVSLDTIFSKYVFLACVTKYFTSSLLFKFRVVFLLLKSAPLFQSLSNVNCEPGRLRHIFYTLSPNRDMLVID